MDTHTLVHINENIRCYLVLKGKNGKNEREVESEEQILKDDMEFKKRYVFYDSGYKTHSRNEKTKIISNLDVL